MQLGVEINGKVLHYKTKDLYFCDEPHDVSGCDVARFLFCPNAVHAPGFILLDGLTSVIDLTCDIDKIWNAIDRKSTRHPIIRAEKLDVDIKINQNYEEFQYLFKEFKRAKGFGSIMNPGAPPVEEMKKGTLISATIDGSLVCGNLYLEDDATSMLWISASRRLFENPETAKRIGDINKMIHWVQICRSKENGLTSFDWGGLWQDEEVAVDRQKLTLNNFKIRFGGKPTLKYHYFKNYSRIYGTIFSTYARIVKNKNIPKKM
jgi:hypothetical protein